MSDAADPRPEPELESPPARTRRRTTFVGRLTDALREQNWAAVAIELGIVVHLKTERIPGLADSFNGCEVRLRR